MGFSPLRGKEWERLGTIGDYMKDRGTQTDTHP